MSTLQSFPFKNMKIIVDLLFDHDEIGIPEIARATGMCSFDSREVTDMLAYLTSFGRVEESTEGWTIVKFRKGSIFGDFREAFLESMEKILRCLTPSAQTAKEIAQETQLHQDQVEEHLPFLAEITRLGVISRCSSASVSRSWCILPRD